MPKLKLLEDLLAVLNKEISDLEDQACDKQQLANMLVEHIREEKARNSAMPSPAETRFKDLSALQAAKIVLAEYARPMRVADILEEVLAGGYPSNMEKLKQNLGPTLSKHFAFINTSHGSYALAKGESSESEDDLPLRRVVDITRRVSQQLKARQAREKSKKKS